MLDSGSHPEGRRMIYVTVGEGQLFLIIPGNSTCLGLFLAAFHGLSLLSESCLSPDLDSLLLFLEQLSGLLRQSQPWAPMLPPEPLNSLFPPALLSHPGRGHLHF